MAVQVAPVSEDFVAELSGIDARSPLSPGEVAQIVAALDRYAVVVLRDQPLTQDEQLAFTRQFGPLDIGLTRVSLAADKRPPRRLALELVDISNLDVSGQIADRDSARITGNIANQLWHSDSSFQNPSARYSMLSAQQVAAKGGDTEFCDLRAAYDGLDPEWAAEIDGLVAEHFALHSRSLLGNGGYTQQQLDALPPVEWPLVRTHPGSGRKLLFVGVHTRRVIGMGVAEGRMLLLDLLEHATQRAFVHAHKWRVGDFVIWDNRAVLHRGRRFDFDQPREMRRSTTLDAPVEAAQAAE